MKVREVIFLCGQIHSGQFRDTKSLDLHEKSLEMADKVFCPNTKNNFTNIIMGGALVVLCP